MGDFVEEFAEHNQGQFWASWRQDQGFFIIRNARGVIGSVFGSVNVRVASLWPDCTKASTAGKVAAAGQRMIQ